MGGITQPLAQAAKPLIEDTAGKIASEYVQYGIRSSEGFLSRFESGKWFMDAYKGWERDSKQDTIELAQPYLKDMSKSLPKDVRQSNAKFNVDLVSKTKLRAERNNATMYFGPNKDRLAQAVNNIRNESQSSTSAQLSADLMSIMLREQGTGDITKGAAASKFYGILKAGGRPSGADLEGWRAGAGIKTASPYQPSNVAERGLKTLASYADLSKLVIPHLGQPAYTLLNEGLEAFFNSAISVGKDYKGSYDTVTKSAALFDDWFRGMRDIADGKDTIIHKLFHMPGFQKIREMQVLHSGIAAQHHAFDMGEALTKGSKFADIELKRLGLDPSKILQQGGKLTHEDVKTAIYEGANRNFFIRRGVMTPGSWGATPLSRTMMMFRGFGYGAQKMIFRSLKDAWQTDKIEFMKRATIFGTVLPATGFMIQGLINLSNLKDPFDQKQKFSLTGNETVDTIINAYSHVGATAFIYALFRAAAFRSEADWINGPVLGLGVDTLKSLNDLKNLRGEKALKRMAYHIPVFGGAIGSHADEISDWVKLQLASE